MFTVNSKVYSFTVTTEQVISAQDIQNIIWDNGGNKITAIKLIRDRFRPIGLKDAKEIYEAVEAEGR